MIIPIFIIIFAVGSFACSHQSFDYTPGQGIYKTTLDPKKGKEIKSISGEGNGFVWDSCEKVNKKALDDLKSKVPEGHQVSDLKWFDRQHNKYSVTPSCKIERGWLYAVYTFWWPKATKVTVKGTLIKPNQVGVASVSSNIKPAASTETDLYCSISQKGDKFDESITLSSYDCRKQYSGSESFLRSFISKKNGNKSYQVYSVIRSSEWPRLYSAAYIIKGKVINKELINIDKDVKCHQYGCNHTVEVAFEISAEHLNYLQKNNIDLEIKHKGKALSAVTIIGPVHIALLMDEADNIDLAH